MAQVPDVAIAAVDVLFALLHGHVMRLCVGYRLFARDDVPFAPRRDNFQLRRESFACRFEAALVVALAFAAMRNGIGSYLLCDWLLPLRDQLSRERSADCVFAF